MMLLADDAISNFPAFDICADFNYSTGVFMAQNNRRPILMSVFLNMNIGATDSTCSNFDENPTWLDLWFGPITLKLDMARAFFKFY
jgi:hypothetical protein